MNKCHSAKVLVDSISPAGHRLTTMEVTFPRSILSEFNTHRVFSRNSASSRAIPVEKMIKMVQEDPYVPTHWGQNQKGMQAEKEIVLSDQQEARGEWRYARDKAVESALHLLKLGVHKQVTNRLLEPFMWHTVVVSSTEWSNWFHLRDNEDAHPEIQKVARLMTDALGHSTPHVLEPGQWHMPFVGTEMFDGHPEEQKPASYWRMVSVGRCARVSYLTHDGKRDPDADFALAQRLLESGHMSPFEHVAKPMTEMELEVYRRDRVHFASGKVWNDVRLPSQEFCERMGATRAPRTWGDLVVDDRVVRVEHTHFCGNYNGWVQARKEISNEWDILGDRQ